MNAVAAAKRKVSTPHESDDYFGMEFAKSADLGDPKPILAFLAQSIIETLAGIETSSSVPDGSLMGSISRLDRSLWRQTGLERRALSKP
jgi:hypothetical protein